MLRFVSNSKAAMLVVLCKELADKFTAKNNLGLLKLEETSNGNWQWRLYKNDLFVDYDVILHTSSHTYEDMAYAGYCLATKTSCEFRVMMCMPNSGSTELPCLVAEDTRGSFTLSQVIAAAQQKAATPA